MTRFELVVAGLAGLSLIGFVVLRALGQDTGPLEQIVISLVSFVLGLKKDSIVGFFKK